MTFFGIPMLPHYRGLVDSPGRDRALQEADRPVMMRRAAQLLPLVLLPYAEKA